MSSSLLNESTLSPFYPFLLIDADDLADFIIEHGFILQLPPFIQSKERFTSYAGAPLKQAHREVRKLRITTSASRYIDKNINFADYKFFAVETLILGSGCLILCNNITFTGMNYK